MIDLKYEKDGYTLILSVPIDTIFAVKNISDSTFEVIFKDSSKENMPINKKTYVNCINALKAYYSL